MPEGGEQRVESAVENDGIAIGKDQGLRNVRFDPDIGGERMELSRIGGLPNGHDHVVFFGAERFDQRPKVVRSPVEGCAQGGING